MTSAAKHPRKIVAEVWARVLIGVEGTTPTSRHTTVAKAEAMVRKLNRACLSDAYIVLALWGGKFLPLVSWAGVIKTLGDQDWVFNGQRFATANEAMWAVKDLHFRWTAVTEYAVAPTSDPVNYRWDDLTGRAVRLDAPPAAQDEPQQPAAAPEAPEAQPASGDPTEPVRRAMVAAINADPGSREALEAEHGQVWSTSELTQDYEVLGFMAPIVVVRRKSDGKKGSLFFQHSPRFYWGFQEA